MIRRILQLVSLAAPHERRLFVMVLLSAMVMSVMELVGVASILPFMSLVIDPQALERSPTLLQLMERAGAITRSQQLWTLGGATATLLVLSSVTAAANLWSQLTFGARVKWALCTELLAGFSRMPYAFHTHRDAASLYKVMTDDVRMSYDLFLLPLLMAFSRGLVAALLLGFVLVYDPMVALAAVVLIGGSYVAIYAYVRHRQRTLGEILNTAYEQATRAALETLAGIKELRVLARERAGTERYALAMRRAVVSDKEAQLNAMLPRFVIESVAFGGVTLLVLLLVQGGESSAVIPSLAMFTVVGYRLLPAVQAVYFSASNAVFNEASVQSLAAALTAVRDTTGSREPDGDVAPLPFARTIELRDVTFRYPTAPAPALHNVSLTIRRGESIGLIGRTGAGKSTVADLLLGLYTPEQGAVCIDGEPLTPHNVRRWRRHVGYVPQQVFLANASVAENIAFGIAPNDIDHERVRRAAEQAQALEFIERLPEQFGTLVGERGVRLSGGQRQRLGIARALYHEPDVLVFDEATSALDGLTEDAVMDAIRTLAVNRTVILIAHRLRTVEVCDRLVLLDSGRIADTGTFAELAARSPAFRTMIGKHTAPTRTSAVGDAANDTARETELVGAVVGSTKAEPTLNPQELT